MEENQEMPDIRKMELEIFEKENPEKMEIMKRKIDKKMKKTISEVNKMLEKEVQKYFKDKKEKMGRPSYIG